MKASLAFLIVLSLSASTGFAQRGAIEGIVRDSSGMPVSSGYVEVINVARFSGIDPKGQFRIEVPAGTQWLLITGGGGACVALVRVPSRGVARAEFVVNDTRSSIYLKQRREFDLRGVRISVEGGQPPNSTVTSATTSNGFEFSGRYCVAQDGDSVLVNVIAQAKNISNKASQLCGSFSMWTYYGVPALSHDGVVVAGIPDSIPRLNVPGLESRAEVLDCDALSFAPGKVFERGIAFRFDPRTFTRWAGNLVVVLYFNSGRPGVPWERTDCFYVGQLSVPIRPISQPKWEN